MSNHYFKGLIFSVLACAAPVAQAELVSADDAKALAAEFFGAGINEKLASSLPSKLFPIKILGFFMQ